MKVRGNPHASFPPSVAKIIRDVENVQIVAVQYSGSLNRSHFDPTSSPEGHGASLLVLSATHGENTIQAHTWRALLSPPQATSRISWLLSADFRRGQWPPAHWSVANLAPVPCPNKTNADQQQRKRCVQIVHQDAEIGGLAENHRCNRRREKTIQLEESGMFRI